MKSLPYPFAALILGSALAGTVLAAAPAPANAAEPLGVFLSHADFTASSPPHAPAPRVDEAVFFTPGNGAARPGYECVPVAEVAMVRGHALKRSGQICRALSGPR